MQLNLLLQTLVQTSLFPRNRRQGSPSRITSGVTGFTTCVSGPPVAPTDFASVSLKTSNRRDALDASEHLAGFVRAFHLENPDAPWSKLKEHFRVVSVELFEAGRDDNVTQVWGGLHDSHSGSVRGSISSLTSVKNAPVPLTVITPAMTFEALSALYLADRGQDPKASTLKETKICHGTISSALGELDIPKNRRGQELAGSSDVESAARPYLQFQHVQGDSPLVWAGLDYSTTSLSFNAISITCSGDSCCG